jgi:hypothetical protein
LRNAAGTRDTDAVAAKMRELPVNDFITKNGKVRIDGRVLRNLYLLQVKKPEESKASGTSTISSPPFPARKHFVRSIRGTVR